MKSVDTNFIINSLSYPAPPIGSRGEGKRVLDFILFYFCFVFTEWASSSNIMLQTQQFLDSLEIWQKSQLDKVKLVA